ncbi:hypothetical protein D3C81_2190520 [compost metagenome]
MRPAPELVHALLQYLHLLMRKQLQHYPADFKRQLISDVLYILWCGQRTQLQQFPENIVQDKPGFIPVP